MGDVSEGRVVPRGGRVGEPAPVREGKTPVRVLCSIMGLIGRGHDVNTRECASTSPPSSPRRVRGGVLCLCGSNEHLITGLHDQNGERRGRSMRETVSVSVRWDIISRLKYHTEISTCITKRAVASHWRCLRAVWGVGWVCVEAETLVARFRSPISSVA